MSDAKQMTDEEVEVGIAIYGQLFEWAQRTCSGQPLSVATAVATGMAAVAGHVTQWAADAQGIGSDEAAIEMMTDRLKDTLEQAAKGKRPTEGPAQ